MKTRGETCETPRDVSFRGPFEARTFFFTVWPSGGQEIGDDLVLQAMLQAGAEEMLGGPAVLPAGKTHQNTTKNHEQMPKKALLKKKKSLKKLEKKT